MKIVGISGGSAAGKTTVSKGLAKMLPNAIFIDADLFFREATEKLEDEIFARLGVVKSKNRFNLNYFFETKENMDIWIEVVKDYVSSRIEEAVAKLGVGKDFVIVDWCYLPMCDFFYQCDMTLCIRAERDTRYKRFISRTEAIKAYSIETGPALSDYEPETLINRVKFSAIEEYGYNQSDYIIDNDSDFSALNTIIGIIANSLLEMSNPNGYVTEIRNSKSAPEFARHRLKKPIVETRNGVIIS